MCISFFLSERRLRLSDALLSSLISIVLVGGFMIFEQFGWRSEIGFSKFTPSTSLAIIPSLFLVVGTLSWRHYLYHKLVVIRKKIHFVFRLIFSKQKVYQIIILALLLLYIVGLFTWQYAEDFKVSTIYVSGIAPWFIYPMIARQSGTTSDSQHTISLCFSRQ